MPENRLINEKSPYLLQLQHAHNPVDCYPWGEEVVENAKNQEKPIFLSIKVCNLPLVSMSWSGNLLIILRLHKS
ncbi:MAG: DUF255 domain-containing protein [Candidatus Neptunochlamydia sp.]|nr:DUF255 domain-containing protein [Candidatus Neptunochlamydia sp.]